MSKSGFTLVELLSVLAILAVILVLVFPAVSNVLLNSRETVYDVQINKILDATYDYTLKNLDMLPEYGEIKYITLNELKNKKLINADIKDTITDELFAENLVISIKNVGSNYNNKNKYSNLEGTFLYTVENELMNTDAFKDNMPIISFSGYDASPIVLELNLGDSYNELTYTATSIDSEDLTQDVVKNIIYNSQNIDEVNTSQPGIYYINYSVVDNNGYSNYATVNVIVVDDELPNLIIPENVTIDTSITSYDLMDGVSCTDNSGVCNITLNGVIEFGVSGKYIIEYKASDSVGNTTILKRVITVE